ncbi:MAG: CARDB domain-containing protein [Candidatus Aminicenantes bacterium]|jgi:hypothetical protein
MKTINLILIFFFLVSIVPGSRFLYCQELPGVSAFLVTQPQGGDQWFIGKTHEIHYRLINIKKPHRVSLIRAGKYLGDFAGGNDTGTKNIKLAVNCGEPLLNGVKYGPGTDYQVEVAVLDHTIKVRSEVFSILAYQYDPTKTPPGVPFNRYLKPLPDLAIGKVLFFKNDAAKVRVTVINKGPGSSVPCVLQLKVGCGAGVLEKVTVNIPALKGTKPGAWPDPESQKTIEIKSPQPFPISKAIFTIDAGNVVKETHEENNQWVKDNCVK